MTKLIRTSPYRAYQVAVAADGTLWTAGVEALDRPPAGSKDPLVDVMAPYRNSGVIRHFDAAGKQLGSFISQATFKDGFHLVNPGNYLVTANNRVAWYCGDARRYVEIDAAGKVLDLTDMQFPDPAAKVPGIAVTDSGDAFAAVNYGVPPSRQSMICLLDRASNTWVPVRHETSYVVLYGSDGDVLVSELLGEPSRTIRLLRSSH